MNKEGFLYYDPSHDSYFLETGEKPIEIHDGDTIEYEISFRKIKATVSCYSHIWELSKGRFNLESLAENQIPVTLIKSKEESN